MCISLGTALVVSSVVGAGASLATGIMASKNKPKLPELPAPPTAPDPKKVEEEQRRKLLVAAGSRTKNILTSPVGLTQEPTTRKTLLGG